MSINSNNSKFGISIGNATMYSKTFGKGIVIESGNILRVEFPEIGLVDFNMSDLGLRIFYTEIACKFAKHPQTDSPLIGLYASNSDFGEGRIIEVINGKYYMQFDIGIKGFPIGTFDDELNLDLTTNSEIAKSKARKYEELFLARHGYAKKAVLDAQISNLFETEKDFLEMVRKYISLYNTYFGYSHKDRFLRNSKKHRLDRLPILSGLLPADGPLYDNSFNPPVYCIDVNKRVKEIENSLIPVAHDYLLNKTCSYNDRLEVASFLKALNPLDDEANRYFERYEAYYSEYERFSRFIILSDSKQQGGNTSFVGYDLEKNQIMKLLIEHDADISNSVPSDAMSYKNIHVGAVLDAKIKKVSNEVTPYNFIYSPQNVNLLGTIKRNQLGQLMSKIKDCVKTPETPFEDVLGFNIKGEKYSLVNFTETTIEKHMGKHGAKYQIKMMKKFVDIIPDYSQYEGCIFRGLGLIRTSLMRDGKVKIEAVELFNTPQTKEKYSELLKRENFYSNEYGDYISENYQSHEEMGNEEDFHHEEEGFFDEFYTCEIGSEYSFVNGDNYEPERLDDEEDFFEDSYTNDSPYAEDIFEPDELGELNADDYSFINEMGSDMRRFIEVIGNKRKLYKIYDISDPMFAFNFEVVSPSEIDLNRVSDVFYDYLKRVTQRIMYGKRFEEFDRLNEISQVIRRMGRKNRPVLKSV